MTISEQMKQLEDQANTLAESAHRKMGWHHEDMHALKHYREAQTLFARAANKFFAIEDEMESICTQMIIWDDYVPGKGLNQMGRGVVDPETWYWETGYFKEMADA